MSAPLDAVRPKIAPLVRMLSSPNDNEALGAARAIGRVLAGAGLDWHDLAKLIGDVPVVAVYKPAPADAYTRPAPPQPTPKPRRPPSPWPSFSRLKHSQRLAWLDAIGKADNPWDADKRQKFDELRTKMVCRPHECLNTQEFTLFNRLVKLSWLMGIRP